MKQITGEEALKARGTCDEVASMKLHRRQLISLVASAVALPAISRTASALDYPVRPVRWIVAVPPGAGNDIAARMMSVWLSEHLGQPFVVENRAGRGSNIGTEEVARATPDGYVLLLVSSNNASNGALYKDLTFNFVRDVVPVASIASTTLVMVVNPALPTKTLPEFIAYAKANPGKINVASSGPGSIGHLAGEMLKMMTGIDMVHVPYRGNAPALVGLLGDEVDVLFPSIAAALSYIKDGKLRALGVTTATHATAAPDIPSIGEFVPGYELTTWYGIGAPRNTPAAIIDKLNQTVTAGLADPNIDAHFAEIGDTPMPMTAEAFGKLIADDTAKFTKVAEFAHIKLE
jgi:tripartite-type tricarboxylate transporter receptor subunit TctC